MQTGAEWQQAQASTQRPPGPTRIPMAPPVVVLDSACAATTAAPPLQLTEGQQKKGFIDGSIPYAAYNTACTSNAGLEGDLLIPTDHPSTKIFTVATGHKTPWSRGAKLHHPVHDPARTVDIFPGLANQSLLSGEKFSKAGYVLICNDAEVNIYGGRTVKITVSEEAVLKGWRYPRTQMW